MDEQMTKFERIGEVMILHGRDLILGLLFVIVGLFVIKYFIKGVRILLGKMKIKEPYISTVCSALYVFMMIVLISSALVEIGLDSRVVFRSLVVIALALVSLILIIRPYIPTLPFKVGQTVKAGPLLGKVESTSLINTRLRTFDGKTFIEGGRDLRQVTLGVK